MTRDEILSQLHKINPGVELVALTSEYALERTFVCGQGFSYDWVSLDETWPAVRITDITDEILHRIKIKLSDRSLSETDLRGTQLLAMYEGFDTNLNICDAFSGLKDITLEDDNSLYVLCDTGEGETTYCFFSKYALFAQAFEDAYINVDTRWETLSDEDLLSWIERLECEFDSIPLCEYESDTDN